MSDFSSSSDLITVQQQLILWGETLSAGIPEAIVDLFAEESLLLPTLAPNILYGRDEKLTYFKQLMSNPNLRVQVDHSCARLLGDFSVNSGLYTFFFDGPSGESVILPARFTFLYKRERGEWKIMEQHSSRMPEA